jgi:hypothetical protein
MLLAAMEKEKRGGLSRCSPKSEDNNNFVQIRGLSVEGQNAKEKQNGHTSLVLLSGNDGEQFCGCNLA